MNPYELHAQAGHDHHRRFFDELRHWHDEMVLHERSVRRFGPGAACSDECPHAEGQRLWKEARALLGGGADSLTFLRACADGSSRLRRPPASRPQPA